MMTQRKFLIRSLTSTFDQALLSLLNFAIGIALIRLATKEAYGFYSLLFAAGVLSTSLTESLLGSALTTIATQMEKSKREALIARVARLQWLMAGIMALIFGLGADWGVRSSALSESPELVGLSFAAFIAMLAAREYCRTALFIESQASAVLRLDALYVALTLGFALLLILISKQVTVFTAMLVLACANGLSAAFFSTHLWRIGQGFTRRDYTEDVQKLWRLSQWAFVGAIVGWIGNNSYLYFAGIYLGVEASAELNAARMLLVPVALLTVAWSRVAHPTASSLVAAKDLNRLDRFTWKSIGALCAAIVAFTAVLYYALPWLQIYLLGGKYQQGMELTPLWGLYFLINAARAVGTTVLMCYGHFKALFWQGMFSLALLTAGCLFLMPAYGAIGALAAMILVELAELLTNVFYLLPQARLRLQQGTVRGEMP